MSVVQVAAASWSCGIYDDRTSVPFSLASSGGDRRLGVEDEQHRRFLRGGLARRRPGNPCFVVQHSCVEIHSSAHRHGVVEEDPHAVEHSLVVDDLGDDPNRWLVLGPDTAGNVLELVVLISVEGDEIIIHAMAVRPKYRRLLER